LNSFHIFAIIVQLFHIFISFNIKKV
jgi:hypothetical protein